MNGYPSIAGEPTYIFQACVPAQEAIKDMAIYKNNFEISHPNFAVDGAALFITRDFRSPTAAFFDSFPEGIRSSEQAYYFNGKCSDVPLGKEVNLELEYLGCCELGHIPGRVDCFFEYAAVELSVVESH